ncbi:hypothetical protein PVL29_002503 [Vitis rotundifolia]|uniref:Uncharacterized protein n=1 Tax=Vitis rotundifolia TaxID=103349 RepID=A0AA39E5Q2_VITRO|nr:hypothetical protein PVL29_002503 [Vitis rotundifolia]
MVNHKVPIVLVVLKRDNREAKFSSKMIDSKKKNKLYYLDTSSGNTKFGFITFNLIILHLIYLRSCFFCFLRILM